MAMCVCSIKETPTGDKEKLKQNVGLMIGFLKKTKRAAKGFVRPYVAYCNALASSCATLGIILIVQTKNIHRAVLLQFATAADNLQK
jgi:hypothetical protein